MLWAHTGPRKQGEGARHVQSLELGTSPWFPEPSPAIPRPAHTSFRPHADPTALETVRRPCAWSFLNQVILLPYTPKGTLMNLCERAQEVMVVSARVAGKQRGLLLVT